MILSMMTALLAIFILPLVFLGALTRSADAHAPPLRQTLSTLVQPIAGAAERALTFARRHL
jgi:hypothetical protein